jgi:hypothetical protein
MKKIYLLFLLFATPFFFAQNSQLYYSGKFYNAKDKPQNFLKILNKNNGISELTDDEGFAIIQASVYDTLVWNNGKNTLVIQQYNLRELKNILENKTPKNYSDKIYSKAYDSLVQNNEKDNFSILGVEKKLSKNSNTYFSTIRKLKSKNDSVVKLKQQDQSFIIINGGLLTSAELKIRNEIPQTQTKYAQGRSQNGNLVWKGSETNEMFSFGPEISTLGFDNSAYQYDNSGKLIPFSNGISPAKIYDNSIFQEAVSFNNQLNFNVIFKKNYSEKLRLSVDFGQEKNESYLQKQFDISKNFKTKLSGSILGFHLNAAFNFDENKATNTNRIGLYNRAYQNSLLTPISFSNAQKIYLNNGNQRSYSQFADNPEFLFDQKNKYQFENNRKQYSFGLIKNWNDFKIDIKQSLEEENIVNNDEYKPSTNGFFNGISNQRKQNNQFYNSSIYTSYEFGGDMKNIFSFTHLLNRQNIKIDQNLSQNYLYERTSQDYLFNYKMDFNDYNDFEFGVNLGNSFYASSTALENAFWLPKTSAYFTFENIFDWNNWNVTFIGAFTKFVSEPNMSKSYGNYATTQYSAQNIANYFPINEVDSFKNISTINGKEWKTGIKLKFGYKLSLEAEYFNRKITDDVFPVFESNILKLKNLATHTLDGFDLNFNFDNFRISNDFFSTQKVSFFKYKNVVNNVKSGYNNLPISGFNDVYKTLTEGEILGAIRGSYFERNANGQLIIDEFGYPKKANGLKIIADPTPDFVMKFTHQFNYKRFSLDINWEWKKGGEIWNGTEAVLDYYGRSQNSADLRNTTNFIFDGVNSNGSTNQIPVDFYNINQDVSENRWTRYGYLGIAEDYVEKADYIRINSISISAKLGEEKYRNALSITFYVNNILLWQAKKGADPNQNFYDLENGNGLDFFNLPSFKTFGCAVSFKF